MREYLLVLSVKVTLFALAATLLWGALRLSGLDPSWPACAYGVMAVYVVACLLKVGLK